MAAAPCGGYVLFYHTIQHHSIYSKPDTRSNFQRLATLSEHQDTERAPPATIYTYALIKPSSSFAQRTLCIIYNILFLKTRFGMNNLILKKLDRASSHKNDRLMECTVLSATNETMGNTRPEGNLLHVQTDGIANLRTTERSTNNIPHDVAPLAISESFSCSEDQVLDMRGAPKRSTVLWCLKVDQDGKSNRTFYRDEPWEGINNGLPDSDLDEHLDTRSVLTYNTMANVVDLTGKESNTSTTWRQRPVDFQFGRDAILMHRRDPFMTIHSRKVVNLINAALPYYPYRVKDDEFTAVLDTFPPIMHCYQELKHYFNSYVETLPQD
jgi:hypothetical protein